jgi:hypothetical protein
MNGCDSRLFEQGGLHEDLNIEFLEPRSDGVVAKMPISPRHPQNRKKREPTSVLEPLTCTLRVRRLALQKVAQVLEFRIFKAISLPWFYRHCRALRSG